MNKRLYLICAEFKDLKGENAHCHMFKYVTPMECVRQERILEDTIIKDFTSDTESILIWSEEVEKDINLKHKIEVSGIVKNEKVDEDLVEFFHDVKHKTIDIYVNKQKVLKLNDSESITNEDTLEPIYPIELIENMLIRLDVKYKSVYNNTEDNNKNNIEEE